MKTLSRVVEWSGIFIAAVTGRPFRLWADIQFGRAGRIAVVIWFAMWYIATYKLAQWIRRRSEVK